MDAEKKKTPKKEEYLIVIITTCDWIKRTLNEAT